MGEVFRQAAEGVRLVGVEGARAVFDVGSGHYRFRVAR